MDDGPCAVAWTRSRLTCAWSPCAATSLAWCAKGRHARTSRDESQRTNVTRFKDSLVHASHVSWSTARVRCICRSRSRNLLGCALPSQSIHSTSMASPWASRWAQQAATKHIKHASAHSPSTSAPSRCLSSSTHVTSTTSPARKPPVASKAGTRVRRTGAFLAHSRCSSSPAVSSTRAQARTCVIDRSSTRWSSMAFVVFDRRFVTEDDRVVDALLQGRKQTDEAWMGCGQPWTEDRCLDEAMRRTRDGQAPALRRRRCAGAIGRKEPLGRSRCSNSRRKNRKNAP